MNAKKHTADRQRLIRLIHVAKRELRLDEETYRDMLLGVSGKASSADLSTEELEKVLAHLKRNGFKVRSKRGDVPQADDAQSRMIRGLWLELHQTGAVRNASEAALAAFTKRMTGVDALQWLTSEQASKLIEELKRWLSRVSKSAA